MVDSKNKKQKKCLISEEDISTVLQRYTANTILALLQEVVHYEGAKIDWNEIVKNTSTGISSAREYQILWRHLAYRHQLLEKLEDGAEPLDEESDLESELEAYPSVSHDALTEAAACVKVMIASGLPSDSCHPNNAMIEAPLTINVPNGLSFRASSEKPQPAAVRGMNITVPVSVQKLPLPSMAPAEGVDAVGPTSITFPPRRKRKPWSEEEDIELINAVKKFGEGNWATILRADFKGDRTASQLSQRWAIIRKKRGHSNSVANNSSSLLLSEAQEAARHAMNLALDPPTKSTIANRSCVTPSNNLHSSTVPPTSASEMSHLSGPKSFAGGTAANNLFTNVVAPSPTAEPVPAQHQPQQNSALKNTTVGGPVPSSVSPAATTEASTAQHQSRVRPILMKSSPMGPANYVGKSQTTSKSAPGQSLAIDPVTAAAVAAGARLATEKDAFSMGPVHNVRFFSTGLTPTPHTGHSSGNLRAGSVKASSQQAHHVPATSTTSLAEQAIAKLPAKQIAKPVGETKESGSEDVGKGVQEDGACSSGNESSIANQEDKITLPDQESNELPVSPTLKMTEGGDLADVIGNPSGGSQNVHDSNAMGSPVKEDEIPSSTQENGDNHSISDRQDDLLSMSINESCDKVEGK